jgi:hypothetical protein
MPILVGVVILGLVFVRIKYDLARAPWLFWSRVLFAAGVIPSAIGGVALGGLVFAVADRNAVLSAILLLATASLLLGPRRIVEILLGGGARPRFLYLALWAKALLHTEPPGVEPPDCWNYEKRIAELDRWTDPRTRPYAELLAARTREWRTAAHGSPLDRVRREIELAHWLAPDAVDPAATRRWQLYADYWVAVADSPSPERRAVVTDTLNAFRDSTNATFIDLVVGSLAKPLPAWPWDSIEEAARTIWPDGYALMKADAAAQTLTPTLPVPTFGPDWDRATLPVRPPA